MRFLILAILTIYFLFTSCQIAELKEGNVFRYENSIFISVDFITCIDTFELDIKLDSTQHKTEHISMCDFLTHTPYLKTNFIRSDSINHELIFFQKLGYPDLGILSERKLFLDTLELTYRTKMILEYDENEDIFWPY